MLTLVSAFYILNSKFSIEIYKKWFDYFLTNLKKCNLIIFTNKESYYLLKKYENINIKIIIVELEDFYTYRYHNLWKKNHLININLNKITSWELNMLWNEKISFVKKAIELNIFNTDWYGWCDIGYFRPESKGTLSIDNIKSWPNYNIIKNLNSTKIYYALINNNNIYINKLIRIINDKNELKLPKNEIPPNQISIAGGFFLINKEKIDWWFNYYYNKLELYFKNNYLIKDDQIIIADCIFSNMINFHLIKEENNNLDNWFLFQRFLFK